MSGAARRGVGGADCPEKRAVDRYVVDDVLVVCLVWDAGFGNRERREWCRVNAYVWFLLLLRAFLMPELGCFVPSIRSNSYAPRPRRHVGVPVCRA